MKKATIAATVAKDPENNSGTVNIPVHRTSTILFPTLKDYHNAEKNIPFYKDTKEIKLSDISYGIGGTPTSFALQKAVAELDGADHAFIFPSGLSAITTVLLAFLSKGDHILVTDTVYGPTRRFCNKELKKFGIETTYYDPLIGEGIKSLVQENTRIIFTESPGSLTFEVQDIPAIVKVAHEKDIVVVMDNSWATSFYFDAFAHGVDVCIQAGTKYIGGHSDLIIGTASCNDKHFDKLAKACKHYGIHTSADDCYLALRGIRTMATRLKAHEKSALNIAKTLSKHRKVSKVLHPALSSCPGYEIFKRDFTGSTGLFTIILDKNYSFEALSEMIDDLKLFGIGASWGGYESLIINFDPTSIRTAAKWTYQQSCVRIYIGLEDEGDLVEDLLSGLERLG